MQKPQSNNFQNRLLEDKRFTRRRAKDTVFDVQKSVKGCINDNGTVPKINANLDIRMQRQLRQYRSAL